jgi:hypothetical protein
MEFKNSNSTSILHRVSAAAKLLLALHFGHGLYWFCAASAQRQNCRWRFILFIVLLYVKVLEQPTCGMYTLPVPQVGCIQRCNSYGVFQYSLCGQEIERAAILHCCNIILHDKSFYTSAQRNIEKTYDI